MSAKIKYGLSAAVLALIAAGASAPQILDQFLDEKEGNHTTAYRDGSGIWTICRGATMVDGKPVFPGMKLSKEKCDQVNAIERDKALAWVEKNIKVPLSEPQKAGIASFCPYNIGPGKCFPSTFYNELMQVIAGERVRRFAGGLRTVAETAVFVQTTATVRYPVVTGERAGVLGYRQISRIFC
ncbi:membrane-associated lysozyme; Qin prophage [Escherichia coli]|uniref:Lysozyme n=6 Tax=Escherichia coli TaxID=562 RepID=A0A2X3M046_ECOLX|nr:membrane-associated lysozyme; Qin prophage [Escherichia coli]